ncbi:MAG: HEPN domain-containing protein [Bacteroidetes bacterium]|nr:HEPN domain-containing protein [Bacteroidota bacterium]
MNATGQIDYWLKSGANDLETAEIIFQSGKNYHHCLFFCHTVLEKGLKALVSKHTQGIPPRSHNLLRLAELAELKVPPEVADFFTKMNGFQLEARYPDEEFRIYTMTTKTLAQKLLLETKETFSWMERLAKQ